MRIERDGALAVLVVDTGKGNAMTAAFVDALEDAITALSRDDVAAVVITGTGRFFSAGLALPELIRLDRPGMGAFLTRFDEVMTSLLRLPKPVVAAINGHAIAGGCILAMQCDRRLMVDVGAKIGLTEVTLGIGLPPSALEPLRAKMPPPTLGPVALEGRLFDPSNALELKLVDELAPDDRLVDQAKTEALRFASHGPGGYGHAKTEVVAPIVERIEARRGPSVAAWLDTWFADAAQAKLREAVAKLGG